MHNYIAFFLTLFFLWLRLKNSQIFDLIYDQNAWFSYEAVRLSQIILVVFFLENNLGNIPSRLCMRKEHHLRMLKYKQ